MDEIIPPELAAALDEFAAGDGWVPLWKVYPDVDEETDERMPACEGMSDRFCRFLAGRGFAAAVIEADQPTDSDADYHRWVRVVVGPDTYNIDWTARQYHNLEWPPAPALQDLPCPLIWSGNGPAHPIVDFTRQHEVALPVELRADLLAGEISIKPDFGGPLPGLESFDE